MLSAFLLAGAAGCARQDASLQQHQEKLESLASTTTAIAEAWLGGSTSGTYTVTALTRTLALVEQERSAFATLPEALLDHRGAALSQQAERLSRLIASMVGEVRAADGQGVRSLLTSMPLGTAESR